MEEEEEVVGEEEVGEVPNGGRGINPSAGLAREALEVEGMEEELARWAGDTVEGACSSAAACSVI